MLTMDGVGEWATTSVAIGRGNTLETVREIHWPHSIGLLYSAFTYYTGFKVNSGEYKVMGLAPYGEPRYADLILDKIVDLKEDGSFWLDQSYFNYATGLTMTSRKFHDLFGGPPRERRDAAHPAPHGPRRLRAEGHRGDHAAHDARSRARPIAWRTCASPAASRSTASPTARSCATAPFKRIWMQPAAGDAGGSVGAALAAYHQHLGAPRQLNGALDAMHGSYLGPEYSQQPTSRAGWRRRAPGSPSSAMTPSSTSARAMRSKPDTPSAGSRAAWSSGRARSAPARSSAIRAIREMQKQLNLKIKYRESFRPFAPSVLREDVADYFELEQDSPYMLLVADVKRNRRRHMTAEEEALFGIDKLNVVRSDIPAVTHVDYSARIQTVHAETNPRYHALLSAFKERTGCAVLVNTSFNVRGEPIVCTPEDAFRCFMGTEMETLVIGNCILSKDQQDPALAKNYKSAFELD